ncbi:MAG: SDR family oxidoreductase [Polyangia bacterium]
MSGMLSLAGEVALITGASSGIGAALGRELARRGAKLVLVARRTDKLESLAAELRAAGTQVLVAPADVTRDGELEKVVEQAQETFGRLDIAVANAGFGVAGTLAELGIDDMRRQFETNYYGALRTFYATHAALRERRGRLVFIGSVAGFIALPGQIAYAASKFALRALAEGLALELGPEGIAVTHIAPGFVESEIRRVDNQGRHHEGAEEKFPRWLLMPTDEAAAEIADAIEGREPLRIITRHGRLAVALTRLSPRLVGTLLRLVRLRGRGEPR